MSKEIVICDASPLIFLAKLDCLHLISDLLGGDLIVLRCVVDEVLSPSAGPVERRRLEGFLKSVKIVDSSESDYESHTLSDSDRITLTYAIRSKAAWLVADERLLRRIAKEEGLRVVGFLGLLVQSEKAGLMSASEARQLVDAAISEHDLRISIGLYQRVVEELDGD